MEPDIPGFLWTYPNMIISGRLRAHAAAPQLLRSRQDSVNANDDDDDDDEEEEEEVEEEEEEEEEEEKSGTDAYDDNALKFKVFHCSCCL